MPQLNPSPWFLILLMTWIMLMIVYLNKTLNLFYPNLPTKHQPEKEHLTSWTWPWH